MASKLRHSLSQEDQIRKERLRQAKVSFDLHIWFVRISAIATLSGVCLLLTGHTSQGAVVTIGGLTTAIGKSCLQISREANDRLDLLVHELTEEDEFEN